MLKKIGEVFRNLSSFFRHPYQCSDMKIRLDAALKNSLSLNFHTYWLNCSICVWKSLVFQIVGSSHQWGLIPVLKNVGERSTAKNYCPVSLLSVVNKVFEKLVNNKILDHLEKCGLFSDFWYGFRSFRSTEDFWQLRLIELPGLLTGLAIL